ncbi:unnamed protein product, partial [Ixodes pacificus]
YYTPNPPLSLSHHPLRPLTKKKNKIKGGSLYPSFPPPVLSPSSSSLERCRGAQCWGPSRLRGGHSSLRRSRFTSTRRPRSPLANQHSSIARVAPLASRVRSKKGLRHQLGPSTGYAPVPSSEPVQPASGAPESLTTPVAPGAPSARRIRTRSRRPGPQVRRSG